MIKIEVQITPILTIYKSKLLAVLKIDNQEISCYKFDDYHYDDFLNKYVFLLNDIKIGEVKFCEAVIYD